ncbi:MAG TPA: hypothetical protein VGR02_23135 [Thermoanaerobaculia bacterium]|jgi:hypothetical protein|nr:hypothetical protein [Thermoanaerobaculia bacterium]
MRRLLLLLAVSTLAQGQVPPCATGAETSERVRELGAYSRAAARQRLGKGLSSVVEKDGLYIVEADVTNAPYLHQVDLAGKTILLQRKDASTFRASIAPLDFDNIPGAERTADAPYALPFDFPFFDKTVRQLTISSQHALYLATPRTTTIDQRNDADVVTSGEAIIAPFLTTPSLLNSRTPRVFVRELADTVTITWTIANVSEIQAVLFRGGDIRFSYRTLTLPGGAVVVTSGSESWRGERTRIDALTDLTNETPAAMADITGLTIDRISDLDLYEIRLTVKTPIVPSQAPTRIVYNLSFNGEAGASLRVDRTTAPRASFAAWGSHSDTTAIRIEGGTVVFTVPQTELDPYGPVVSVRASTFVTGGVGDFTTGIAHIPLGTPRRVDTDFTSLQTPVDLSGPIAEAFTLPAISIERVWEQLEQGTSLRGEDLDGVAIYQNFLTDIVFYAGAYATGGNAGVAGIIDDDSVGPQLQREPNIMHMNAIGYGWNRSAKESSFIILHEFGHEWLFYPLMMENGQRAQVINPDGGHPAQFVDMRAAFPVYGDHDASVMGGGAFLDNGNGTFTSTDFSSWGYSWLDLYLMGLASPSEVPPFYYIADSDPPLGESYFPPANRTVRGLRRNIAMQQFLDAMGPRTPAFPNTPRKFRTVFVVLADPAHPVTLADLNAMATYRAQFAANFRIATGGRAEVATAYDPAPARRRSLR